jgi:hypothetical protein
MRELSVDGFICRRAAAPSAPETFHVAASRARRMFDRIRSAFLGAYRHQYILSGVEAPRTVSVRFTFYCVQIVAMIAMVVIVFRH